MTAPADERPDNRLADEIERVARALAKVRYAHCGEDRENLVRGTPNWHFCRQDAQIAIEALRRPTTSSATVPGGVTREAIARAIAYGDWVERRRRWSDETIEAAEVWAEKALGQAAVTAALPSADAVLALFAAPHPEPGLTRVVSSTSVRVNEDGSQTLVYSHMPSSPVTESCWGRIENGVFVKYGPHPEPASAPTREEGWTSCPHCHDICTGACRHRSPSPGGASVEAPSITAISNAISSAFDGQPGWPVRAARAVLALAPQADVEQMRRLTEQMNAYKEELFETQQARDRRHSEMIDALDRAEAAEARLAEATRLLEWLHRLGGLGFDKHDRIAAFLATRTAEPGASCATCQVDEKAGSRTRYVCSGRCQEEPAALLRDEGMGR